MSEENRTSTHHIRYDANSSGQHVLRYGAADDLNLTTIRVDSYRLNIENSRGLAWRHTLSEGPLTGMQFFGGVGLTSSLSFNHTARPRNEMSVDTQSPPITPSRITLRQGAQLMRELKVATQGTYDLERLTIGHALSLTAEYPILLTEKQNAFFTRVNDAASHGIDVAEAARGKLENAFLGASVSDKVSQSEEYRNVADALSTPISRARLDKLTLGEIHHAANQLDAALKAHGGAKVIGNSIAQKLADASVKLDDKLDDKAPNITVSPEEKAEIIAMFQQVETNTHRVQAGFNAMPKPEDLRRMARLSERVERFDPVFTNTAYVAAAVASPKIGLFGETQAVVAASASSGIKIDADNVVVHRGDRLSWSIHPSSIQERTVSVGVGNPALAMPRELADKLRVAPDPAGEHVGAYVAVRQVREQLAAMNISGQSVEAGFRMSHGLGNGNYAYGEASVAKSSGKPLETKLTIGRTF